MKAKLLSLLLLTLVSCSTPELTQSHNKIGVNIKTPKMFSGCGTIHTVQTLFTSGLPSMFIGVRYDLNLDAPYLGYTKAYFILNDALNTNLTNQFTNMQYVCRNDLVYY